MKVCMSILECVMWVKEEVWSGGRSETTDVKVVWPRGVNGGVNDQEGVRE